MQIPINIFGIVSFRRRRLRTKSATMGVQKGRERANRKNNENRIKNL